ncbi:MAG: hypothetical protein COA96_12075 [SAR86 cluster bacterium]|uniref:Uncharacterized protein n=1 Tax=SAR86 cluster bacterium TaxID=2030880 RepID=A0A2A5AVN1_9GAMM|nr:MAG: hypothetical protein COA96_12075 [SAR86 cluster bacterium]
MPLSKVFKSKVSKITTLLIAVLVSQFAMAQTEMPATVPASFVGTYDLTYSQSSAGASFADNEAVTVVVGSDNTLCVAGLVLSNPILRNGNGHEAIWTDSASSLEYALSSLISGYNEINVASTAGSFFGQLRGSKVSDSTSCDGSSSTPVVTDVMNQVFALAESKVGEYFPSGAITQFFENYVYRFYESTGIYIAFSDGNVFLRGGTFGEAIVDAGTISSVLATLETYQAANPNPGTSADLWNLSISGTVTTFGTQVNFGGISIASVPAPNLDNTSEINQEINSTLAGVATGISSISITVVNNTSSQRTFDVSFTAVANGLNISYNLRYDYTQ